MYKASKGSEGSSALEERGMLRQAVAKHIQMFVFGAGPALPRSWHVLVRARAANSFPTTFPKQASRWQRALVYVVTLSEQSCSTAGIRFCRRQVHGIYREQPGGEADPLTESRHNSSSKALDSWP